MFFESNDFAVAVAVVVVVVANFECVGFVALAADVDLVVVHASSVDFVPAVDETVVLVHDTYLR